MKSLNFFLIWVFGFFALLSFDLFVEGLVFEWLGWNGTEKNDWFFALWWGFIVVWGLYGAITLYTKLQEHFLLFASKMKLKQAVYKVLTPQQWDAASATGLIVTELDQGDGFIHLSTASQLNATLSLYFSREDQAVLLQLNPDQIKDGFVYEAPISPGKRGGQFPHLYGELNINQVSQVWHLERGAFILPKEVLLLAELDETQRRQ